MKKILYVSVIVVALSVFASAGILWAGPAAPVCPAHGQSCFERNGDVYCTWAEETRVNKLVQGRAGQWQWALMPTYQLKTEKCAVGVHKNL
ncbi:MAG: hypothetical protein WB930_17625 [Syntrophobacteraceae bacterium]